MKRLFSLLVFVALVATTASARSLVLRLTDGTEIYYLIGAEETPLMKFVDGEMYVNGDKYAFSGIDRFYISQTDDPNAIDSSQDVAQRPAMRDGVLYVKSAGKIGVYTLDAKQVQATVKQQSGVTTIDTNSLAPGTYIIRIGDASMKFLKR